MSASTQRLLITVIMGVLGIASLLLAWEMGWEALKMTTIGEIHIGSSVNLPKWPARWFLPIGFGLMALAAFMRARRIVLGEINPAINSDSTEQGSDD
ncbi:MAG: TRAP transporter small permease subunit, partial [Pseudomonadota bacterium]